MYGSRIWYDHPNWWQWLILIGIALVFVFVWWGSAGSGGGDPYRDSQDDGRDMR